MNYSQWFATPWRYYCLINSGYNQYTDLSYHPDAVEPLYYRLFGTTLRNSHYESVHYSEVLSLLLIILYMTVVYLGACHTVCYKRYPHPRSPLKEFPLHL